MKPFVVFKNNKRGVELMAVFVSQLVRECVTFTIHGDDVSYEVILTGGY